MFDKIKSSFSSRKFKNGAYSTILMTVVIAVVILVNLFVGELDINVDISSDAKYTLTDATRHLAKEMEDNISIYYVVQDGNEVDQIQKIVDRYTNLSNKIKVKEIDPVLYPSFTKDYTEETVADNSIIVVNNDTNISKYVPYSDLLISETDYQTYESTVTGIDVEGQITSAIQYVTSDNLPKMYMVEGHGEAELGETITNGISKLNVSTDKLSTLTEKSIPKDCQILLINGPTSDYSKDEVTMIEDYLAAGGKAIIFTSYTTETMTNFKELLTYYGVQLEDGLLVESTGNYVGNYPTYIVPSVKNHDITSSIISNGSVVVMPVAQGITAIDNVRSSLKVEPLLTSSDGSYSKINVDSQTIEKEEGDITGPFHLGVAITETNDEKESKLAIFTSSYLINEEMVSTGQFANGDLLFNAISWMADMQSGLSIPTRSVEQTYLTVSNAQISFWGALLVFILPMMILGSGLFIWLRRRKG